jgi:signal transduction histidine kinase
MTKGLIFVCLWLVTLVGRSQAVESIQIGNKSDWSLRNHLLLFKTTSRLTPAQAFVAARTGPATLLTERHLNLGLEPNYVWLYFRIHNEGAAQTVIFLLDRIDIHRVQCFRRRSGQIDTLALTGDALPFRSRPIKVNYFAIPIPLASGEQSELVILLDKRHEFISGNVGLYSSEKFIQAIRLDSAVIAFFLGMAGFIFLFNFLLWLSLKDSVHLFFMAHLTSTTLYVLSSLGYGFEFIWPELLFSNSLMMTMLSALWASTNLFLMKRFLGLNSSTSRYAQATTGLAWYILIISFVGCSIALFQEQELPVYMLQLGEFLLVTWIIANAVLVVAIFTEQIRKRNEAAYIYVAALSFTILGTIIYTLTLLNLVNAGHFTTNWLLPGFLLEQIILALGLTIRYNRFRQQNLNLQLTLAQERNQTTTQVINAQEIERRRLAADLHDDLGGTLATLRRRLGDLRQRLSDPLATDALSQLEPLVQKSTHDLRRIAHNLMPPEFDRLGLRHALDQLVQSQPAQPTHFSFVVAGQERRLPLDVELNLYRIVSELIQNIHKHAEAQRAAVQLLYFEDHLSVLVEDDGLGNRVTKNTGINTGLGLKNSSLRAEYIGAQLRRDVTGAGTLIVIDVPYATTPYGATFPSSNPSD